MQQLFEQKEIGDWTPSYFLRLMLTGEAATEEFLKTMWLRYTVAENGMKPLAEKVKAIQDFPKPDSKIPRYDELLAAFQALKDALSNAAFLAHPSNRANLAIKVDASDFALGATLQQQEE
ncbi:uncharacterized protein LOC122537477, partial [Frieseomelitta varia]|uniref:uncharacterized protein LOC122537477 n=1 Tax=Frieseomelitta varia TaxID=561572 RepID=UPI001CB6B19A